MEEEARVRFRGVDRSGAERFIEVVPSSRPLATIEVALPSGVVLRVPESVDVTALRGIVDALQGEPTC